VRAETARNTVREYQDFYLPELRELHNMQLALKRSLDNFSQELTQLTALRRSMDSFRQELVQMTVLLREITGSAWHGQGPPAPPPPQASEPADERVYTPILVAQILGRSKVTICRWCAEIKEREDAEEKKSRERQMFELERQNVPFDRWELLIKLPSRSVERTKEGNKAPWKIYPSGLQKLKEEDILSPRSPSGGGPSEPLRLAEVAS
jgi:hypothetical protein